MTSRELESVIQHYESDMVPRLRQFVRQLLAVIEEDPALKGLGVLVKWRVKEPSSLARKAPQLRREGRLTKGNLAERVHDLAGIRIVTYTMNEQELAMRRLFELRDQGYWRIARLTTFTWKGDKREYHDIEGVPQVELVRSDSYFSPHVILHRQGLYCEVQLRTAVEDAVFENSRRYLYRHGGSPRAEDVAVLFRVAAVHCVAIDDVLDHCRRWATEP